MAEVFAIDQDREPIRVLMITSNFGEQMASTEIAAQRMKEIEATTEFEFTITDDIGYINADTLANYDVLFFANTTVKCRFDRLSSKPSWTSCWKARASSVHPLLPLPTSHGHNTATCWAAI